MHIDNIIGIFYECWCILEFLISLFFVFQGYYLIESVVARRFTSTISSCVWGKGFGSPILIFHSVSYQRQEILQLQQDHGHFFQQVIDHRDCLLNSLSG